MNHLIEHIIVSALNRRLVQRSPAVPGVSLGYQTGGVCLSIPDTKRPEHIAILGRTGTGKSSLMRSLILQDIHKDRGFVVIDLHAETFHFTLAALAKHEGRRHTDDSARVVVLDPSDRFWSVGLNVLEADDERGRFVQIAEITTILKQRWQLDSLGARTEELLRNCLLSLSEAGFTLIDLPPFLTNPAFRAACLRSTANAEVRSYFHDRFEPASDAMQTAWREPVLNKVTAFTADPQLRHLLGQRRSTVSLARLLDANAIILLNLDKSTLGEQAATLGSLFLTKLKNAIFARRKRDLVTVFADELQNLVAYNSDLETLFSEARKFGCGFCVANQFLDQYPHSLRAAVLAIGTHVFFQLSAPDAEKLTSFLGGGRPLRHLLANLPPRNFVIKSGHHHWQQGLVPTIKSERSDVRVLYERCRTRWARPRGEVELDIVHRQRVGTTAEALDAWE